ncbi:MAG: hypothetical protein ACTHK6_09595 [Solirubrobacterales bacterium]
MRYLQMIGLAAVAAAALMAFSGSASATTLTCGAGLTCPPGTQIKAKLKEGASVVAGSGMTSKAQCLESTITGKTQNVGSSTETVTIAIEGLTFASCNCGDKILKKGTLEVHTQGMTENNNGTVTSSGTEVTFNCSGFDCAWTTASTDLGVLTGGKPAVLAIKATLNGPGGLACGMTATWEAEYEITEPTTLLVD